MYSASVVLKATDFYFLLIQDIEAEPKPYSASLYHIPDKVVPNINMLGSIVDHKILRKINPTLVITKDNGGI